MDGRALKEIRAVQIARNPLFFNKGSLAKRTAHLKEIRAVQMARNPLLNNKGNFAK
jgi:hypothetical protein